MPVGDEPPAGSFGFWLMVSMFTGVGVLISLPALFYLERKKLRELKHYLIAGSLCALCVFPFFTIIVSLKALYKGQDLDLLPNIFLFGTSFLVGLALVPFGALYALIYWRVSIYSLKEKHLT